LHSTEDRQVASFVHVSQSVLVCGGVNVLATQIGNGPVSCDTATSAIVQIIPA
jgi:hypothetical protein